MIEEQYPLCPKGLRTSLVCYNRLCKESPFICNCAWRCDCMNLHQNCEYLIWNHILNEIDYKKLKNQSQFKDLILEIDETYKYSLKLISKSYKDFKIWSDTFGLNPSEILFEKLVKEARFEEINVRLINDIQKGIDITYGAIVKNKKVIEEQLKAAFQLVNNYLQQIDGIYKSVKIAQHEASNVINTQKFSSNQNKKEVQRFQTLIVDNKLNLTKGISDLSTLKLLRYINAEDLQILDLDNNHIEDIEFLIKLRLPNLESLSLYTNDIISIETLPKTSFPHLQKLFLNYNKIEKLEALSRVVFPNLIILALQNNQIEFLEPLIFCNFENLQTLWLKHNKIQNIEPLTKVRFPNLLKLELQTNRIYNVHAVAKMNFPNLQTLFLHENLINDLYPLSKIKFENLQALWLQKNNYKVTDVDLYKEEMMKRVKQGCIIKFNE